MIKIYKMFHASSDKIYIGQTVKTITARLTGHINDKSICKRTIWIKELLANGYIPEMQIIEEVENDMANSKEIYWIAEYRRIFGYDLILNSTDGGSIKMTSEISSRVWLTRRINGTDNHSDEAKEKMSIAKIGKPNPHTKEWDDNIRKSLIGRKLSEKCIARISASLKGRKAWNVGKKLKESHIENLKTSHTGRHPNQFTKLSLQEVFEIKDLYLNKIYPQWKIAEIYQVSQPTISAAITGRNWKEARQ